MAGKSRFNNLINFRGTYSEYLLYKQTGNLIIGEIIGEGSTTLPTSWYTNKSLISFPIYVIFAHEREIIFPKYSDFNDLLSRFAVIENEAITDIDFNSATSANNTITGVSIINGKATFSVTPISIELSSVTNLTTDLSSKQSKLVSGTNIKTINNQSLLGSGNINIDSVYTGKAPVIIDNTTRVISFQGPTGTTTVSSVSSIPTTYAHVLANVSANATLSFSAIPTEGYDINVIIHNTGTRTITITLPNSGNYICTSYSTIYIASGLYGEVNLVNIGGKGYIRSVNSI